MIFFEVNQTIGRKIKKNVFEKIIRETEKALRIKKNFILSIALVDNKTIKELNRRYRGINQITDVLSFSCLERKFFPRDLGEIIISYPRAFSQAKGSLEKEISFLFLHGLLHLLGFDHQKKKEAEKMEKIEEKILKDKKNDSS